jgi:hypothetical protein
VDAQHLRPGSEHTNFQSETNRFGVGFLPEFEEGFVVAGEDLLFRLRVDFVLRRELEGVIKIGFELRGFDVKSEVAVDVEPTEISFVKWSVGQEPVHVPRVDVPVVLFRGGGVPLRAHDLAELGDQVGFGNRGFDPHACDGVEFVLKVVDIAVDRFPVGCRLGGVVTDTADLHVENRVEQNEVEEVVFLLLLV